MRTIIRNNYQPQMGDYHERIVIDNELHKKWVFDCDGVYTDFTNATVTSEYGDSETIAASQKLVTEVHGDLGEEVVARENEDKIIWDEIEHIKMSSDVVDVVGTYADLMNYDTSDLNDNDLIKVIVDEEHNDGISYYRFNKSSDSFAYVGTEGPYQDKLIAGQGITIAADGKTISADGAVYTAGDNISISAQNVISAVDTTYTAGQNVSISAQNVISATDTTYSAGSGLALNGTTFSVDTTTIQPKLTAGSNITISGDTISATDTTYSDFSGATSSTAGAHGLVPAPASGDTDKYLKSDGTWATVSQYSLPAATASTLGGVKIGSNLSMDANDVLSATDTTYTAGTNVSISSGNVISATDTTYSVFTSATYEGGVVTPGTNGLVPGPTDAGIMVLCSDDYYPWKSLVGTGDITVTIGLDKFEIQSSPYTAGTNIEINGKVISTVPTMTAAEWTELWA